MSSWIRCFAVLLPLAMPLHAGSDCGEPGNLVPNCGFDIDQAGWSIIAATVTPETSDCPTGPRCLYVERDLAQQASKMTSPCIQTTPETFLTFGVTTRLIWVQPPMTCTLNFWEYSNDSCSASTGSPPFFGFVVGDVWQKLRAGKTLTASTNSVQVYFRCILASNFLIGVDDFYAVPAAFTDGFESAGTTAWSSAEP